MSGECEKFGEHTLDCFCNHPPNPLKNNPAMRNYFDKVLQMYSGITEYCPYHYAAEKNMEIIFRGLFPNELIIQDRTLNIICEILGKQLAIIKEKYGEDFLFFEPVFFIYPDTKEVGCGVSMLSKKRFEEFEKRKNQ